MKDPYKRIAAVYDLLMEPLNSGLRGLGMKYAPGGPGVAVLDVCCGTGMHLDMYRQRGCRIVGVDLSPAMVRRARKRLGESSVIRGDATALPFGDGEFDLTICMLALHEMAPDLRIGVVREMKRVLRQDGILLFVDFHPGPVTGIKGRIADAVITVAEFMAGREHFANSRQFLGSGGMRSIIEETTLTTVKERVVGGGTLSVTVCRKRP